MIFFICKFISKFGQKIQEGATGQSKNTNIILNKKLSSTLSVMLLILSTLIQEYIGLKWFSKFIRPNSNQIIVKARKIQLKFLTPKERAWEGKILGNKPFSMWWLLWCWSTWVYLNQIMESYSGVKKIVCWSKISQSK